MLVLASIISGVIRQNGDTTVPHLTGAQAFLYPAHVGKMFIIRDRHLRQLMDRSNSHTSCVILYLNKEPKKWKMHNEKILKRTEIPPLWINVTCA